MAPRVWHSFDTVDWFRVSIFIAAVSVFWATMVAVIPDPYAKWVSTFLLGVSNAVALMLRSGKSRVEKIGDKFEELETKKEETRVEITELLSNEAKEKAEQAEKK